MNFNKHGQIVNYWSLLVNPANAIHEDIPSLHEDICLETFFVFNAKCELTCLAVILFLYLCSYISQG